MFEWLHENGQALDTVANIGMLLVWVAYLQLFLVNFRRQRRPYILVNRGAGRDLDARCLIGNMSSESIYVESIIATLHDDDRTTSCGVTDVVRRDGGPPGEDPRRETRQGPLPAGGYMDVGSFRGMLDQLAQSADAENCVPDRPFEIEVLVIADYASENLVVGARRSFDVEKRPSRFLLKPRTPGTKQIRSRRERRRLQSMNQEYA